MDNRVPQTGPQDITAAAKAAIYGADFNTASDVIQGLIESRIGYYVDIIEKERLQAGDRFDVATLDVHIKQIEKAKTDPGLLELQDIFNTNAYTTACDGFISYYDAVQKKGRPRTLKVA